VTSRPTGDRPVVYLHIGEPKCGTTFLQEVMWSNRATLAAQGMLLPGVSAQDHFRANQDLREVPQAADDPAGSYRGEWELLARQALRTKRASVISHELLAAASAAHAARALESLRSAEVHVILTVRDFVSLLPAEWQETVKHRNTGRWQQWVRRIMRTENGPGPGPWFWRAHDTLAVLRRWSQGLPPGQVHVVTVPPPGSPPDLLWRRFASVIGVAAEGIDLTGARSNTSLGLPEAELLRRLNVALPRERIPDWYYFGHIKESLAHEVLARRPATLRPRLTAPQDEWARARADKVVAGLESSGYDIVGNLDELIPPRRSAPEGRPGAVPNDQVLDAAVAALAAMVSREYAAAGIPNDRSSRLKRSMRNFSARHPRVGALRVLAWRVSERSRARRR
jgi:hypothetical protein